MRGGTIADLYRLYYTMEMEILQDKNKKNGKERPWREKKVANVLLAQIYRGLDVRKAERLEECATYLLFALHEGALTLEKMNSCRVRLCPMCQWRRSLKAYSQTMRIIDYLAQGKRPPAYAFLTLTMRNVTGDRLKEALDNLMEGLNRLNTYSAVRKAVRGAYRGVEITHDVDRKITRSRYRAAKAYYDGLGLKVGDCNPGFDTYHPHVHYLLAVNKSYFTSRDYIPQEKWVEYWRRAMRLDYDPVVDIRRAWGTSAEQIAEISKYACKDSEYVIPTDYELSQETVAILDRALANRRLVAYTGELREAHRDLKMDDVDDGDLIHVDPGAEDAVKEDPRLLYLWQSGYCQYMRGK